jgi:predicted esterase
VPTRQAEELGTLLERGGARVTTHWHNGGHTITSDEVQAAQQWIRSL